MSPLLRLHHDDIMTIVKFVSSPDDQGVVLQLGLGLGPGNGSFPFFLSVLKCDKSILSWHSVITRQ